MKAVATTPMPRPVVQGIRALALHDATRRCGSASNDDAWPISGRAWPAEQPSNAFAFGVAHSITTSLLMRLSRSEAAHVTDAPPSPTCLVSLLGCPNEMESDHVKTFVDFARSFRSIVQDTPWICLQSQWLKMADFAENTQPIDIDPRILSQLSAAGADRTPEPAVTRFEATHPSRGASKLSAVIQRSSAEDDVLEIYAEPVDGDTLEFLRRC